MFPFWPNPSNYQNIDLGLDRVYALLERLDNPHLKLPPTIHIAGTNGKGSTLSFLKAIFEQANLKVHTYTSPHLVEFNERIVLAGSEISDKFLNDVLNKCKIAAEIDPKINVTFFEGITAAAFLAFSKVKADVLLLEVGLGGRLDATNVIKNPIATVLTPIDIDHTEFLGKTLTKITLEKCGIIKENCPVIISKQKPTALKIIIDVAQKNNSEIFSFDQDYKLNITPSLTGSHQIINAKCAIATILALKSKFKISKQNIEAGIKSAVWKARLQKITSGKFTQNLPNNFELYLDGSHNPQGSMTISDWLKNEDKQIKNYLICGMLKEKNSYGFLKNFKNKIELLVGIKIENEPKTKSAKEICDVAEKLDLKALEGTNFSNAIQQITTYHSKNYSGQPAKIIICGSLYLAGNFLSKNF